MSEMPEIGGRQPITVEVEAGKSYWWCACGRSQNHRFATDRTRSPRSRRSSSRRIKPKSMVLRLQAIGEEAEVRRQPQETVERRSMPDLLLELFSEEIPARMQSRAAEDLRKAVTDRLVDAGLVYEGAKAFVTPRRLALAVHGVPARQADVRRRRRARGSARRRTPSPAFSRPRD